MTKMVLQDFEFDGRKLEFHSAFSAAEAKQVLQQQPNAALILLDVVMEQEDAGLQIVRYIREELKIQPYALFYVQASQVKLLSVQSS